MTTTAKKTSNHSCVMIVIHTQLALAIRIIMTNRAYPTLSQQHLVILLRRNAIPRQSIFMPVINPRAAQLLDTHTTATRATTRVVRLLREIFKNLPLFACRALLSAIYNNLI